MDFTITIFIITFILLLCLKVPIGVSIGLSTFFGMAMRGVSSSEVIIAQKMNTGVSSFALLAIPFFILSGILMTRGGIARRLLNFASILIGWLPGGISYVTVLASMLFGSISGSAVAAVSSIGGLMVPEMTSRNYDRGYSGALATASSITGLLIPPSNVMIIYALVAGGVSITHLFMAGVIPGIVLGLSLCVVNGVVCSVKGYGDVKNSKAGKDAKFSLATYFHKLFKSFFLAVPSLILIVVVLGGIVLGFFTATEASAIAVLYSFVLTVFIYREVKIKDIPDILFQCGKMTATVMFLISTSIAMSWFFAFEQIPQMFGEALISISDNKIVILLLINVILLMMGTFMDITPAILIFTPIFLPIMTKFGISPVHFGVIMITNLSIGLCTPPVGTCLVIGCSVSKIKSILELSKKLIPLLVAMLVSLMLITYIPQLSLWFPSLLGIK